MSATSSLVLGAPVAISSSSQAPTAPSCTFAVIFDRLLLDRALERAADSINSLFAAAGSNNNNNNAGSCSNTNNNENNNAEDNSSKNDDNSPMTITNKNANEQEEQEQMERVMLRLLREFRNRLKRSRNRETTTNLLRLLLLLIARGTVPADCCRDYFVVSILEDVYLAAGAWADTNPQLVELFGLSTKGGAMMRRGSDIGNSPVLPRSHSLNSSPAFDRPESVSNSRRATLVGSFGRFGEFGDWDYTPNKNDNDSDAAEAHGIDIQVQVETPRRKFQLALDGLNAAGSDPLKRVSVDVRALATPAPTSVTPLPLKAALSVLDESLDVPHGSSPMFSVSPVPVSMNTSNIKAPEGPSHRAIRYARKLGQTFCMGDVKTLILLRRNQDLAHSDTLDSEKTSMVFSRAMLLESEDASGGGGGIVIPPPPTALRSASHVALETRQTPNTLYMLVLEIVRTLSPHNTPSFNFLIAKEITSPSFPCELSESALEILFRHKHMSCFVNVWASHVCHWGIHPHVDDAVVASSLHAMARYFFEHNASSSISSLFPSVIHAFRQLSRDFRLTRERLQILHYAVTCCCIVLRWGPTVFDGENVEALRVFVHDILGNRSHPISTVLRQHMTLLLVEPTYLSDLFASTSSSSSVFTSITDASTSHSAPHHHMYEDIPTSVREFGAEFHSAFSYLFWDHMFCPAQELRRASHTSAMSQLYILMSQHEVKHEVFDFLLNPYDGALLHTLSTYRTNTPQNGTKTSAKQREKHAHSEAARLGQQAHRLYMLLHLVSHPQSPAVADKAYLSSITRHIYLTFLIGYGDTLMSESVTFCCLCAKVLTQLVTHGGENVREIFSKLGIVEMLASEAQLEYASQMERQRSMRKASSMWRGTTTRTVLSPSHSRMGTLTSMPDIMSVDSATPTPSNSLPPTPSGGSSNALAKALMAGAAASGVGGLGGSKPVIPKLQLQFAKPTAYYCSPTDETVSDFAQPNPPPTPQTKTTPPVVPLRSPPAALQVEGLSSPPTAVSQPQPPSTTTTGMPTSEQPSVGDLGPQTSWEMCSFRDKDNAIPPPESPAPTYQRSRHQSRLYVDNDLHAHIIFLLMSVLVGSTDQLDPRFCEVHTSTKTNVLFLLRKHITHPANRVSLVPRLLNVGRCCGRAGVLILTKIMCVRPGEADERYDVQRKIGSGAYCTVYACEPRYSASNTMPLQSQQKLAMKQVPVPSQIERRNTFIDVHNEVLFMHKLRHSSSVAQLVDFGTTESCFYIVMQRYDATLKAFARKLRPLSDALCLRWFSLALHGVEHLHDDNTAHCDLKCDNYFVLLRNPGSSPADSPSNAGVCTLDPNAVHEIVLGDLSDCVCAKKGEIIAKGTECVRAPEVLAPKQIAEDRRTLYEVDMRHCDVWSIGAMLFELATGVFMFDGSDYGRLVHTVCSESEDVLQPEHMRRLEQMPRVTELLRFILSRNPTRRPTIAEIRERCNEIVTAVSTPRESAMLLRRMSRVRTMMTPRSATPPRVHYDIDNYPPSAYFAPAVVRSRDRLVLMPLCAIDEVHRHHDTSFVVSVHFEHDHRSTEAFATEGPGDVSSVGHDPLKTCVHNLVIEELVGKRGENALVSALNFLQTHAMRGMRIGISGPAPWAPALLCILHMQHAYGLTPHEAYVEVADCFPNTSCLHEGFASPPVRQLHLWCLDVLFRVVNNRIVHTPKLHSDKDYVRCACGQCVISSDGVSILGPTIMRSDTDIMCNVCKSEVHLNAHRLGRAGSFSFGSPTTPPMTVTAPQPAVGGVGLLHVSDFGVEDVRKRIYYDTLREHASENNNNNNNNDNRAANHHSSKMTFTAGAAMDRLTVPRHSNDGSSKFTLGSV
eukprot:PhM_4_TR2903/c0_g1_i1/m.55274